MRTPPFNAPTKVVGALLALLFAPSGPAHAHQLNVFAFIEEGAIVVEAKFSSGRVAREGVVTVYDAADALIHETRLGADGSVRLPRLANEGGLRIEVSAGDGHSNYWILTPQDMARASVDAETQS
ncbi:hypothetical protein [Roseitranquillus sediminis]|uniref:hypothetical protein n=1 Tax=Roseitranquillus sediminis TaxID=2809051 RepID=UPI001D0C867F|nr:hypothetical protein [Roseitranquillus sediminis]MBM9596023.1 hypothetical protein [Roseitranquillus sediminis]